MNILQKKYKCEIDGEKFDTHEKFIDHSRKVHHKVVSKCHKCGKQFISEKERLHHVREPCKTNNKTKTK